MKQLLAREKTVNITGTGSSSCASQIAGGSSKSGVVITSSRSTDNTARFVQGPIKNTKERKIELNKPLKQSTKICDANISKIQVNQDDSISERDVVSRSAVLSNTC